MIRRRSPNENLFRAEFQLDPKTKNTPTAFFDLYLARKTPCVCFFISYIMYVLPRVSRLLFNVMYISHVDNYFEKYSIFSVTAMSR